MKQHRTRIKICGLTREQDVDCAVQAGADAIGFVLYDKSPRAVSVERAAALASRLPPFAMPVLLFVNASDALLQQAATALPHALWQFHGDETPERCNAVTRNGQRAYLRAARIPLDNPAAFDLPQFVQDYASAQAVLLDAHVQGYGGGGQAFNWQALRQPIQRPLVLSGGLHADNVAQGIAALRPLCSQLAVDVSSGVESAKGIKDHDKIYAFVRAVRSADQ